MSITGSLVGFEGSNEINSNKRNARTLLNSSISSKHCSSLNTSLTNSVITSTSCSRYKHILNKLKSLIIINQI